MSSDAARANRLAVALAVTRQVPLEDFAELARLADDLAYESIWVSETWGPDAVTLLSLAAQKTTRTKIASGVLNVYSRSAAVIAQTAATLQTLSGGRFILGLGASGPAVIENWHGIPYRHPLKRTEDYVKAIRLALAGDRVDTSIDGAQLRGFRLLNPPPPPVPIYIAALGPRNTRLAATIADGWLPIFAARGGMQDLVAEFEASARAAGRDPGKLDVASYIPAVLGPGGDRLLRHQLAYYIGGMGTFYNEFVRQRGFEREAEDIRAAWRRGDRLAAVGAVSERLLEACTISGPAPAARTALERYRAEGIKLPVLSPPHGTGSRDIADMLEALASA